MSVYVEGKYKGFRPSAFTQAVKQACHMLRDLDPPVKEVLKECWDDIVNAFPFSEDQHEESDDLRFVFIRRCEDLKMINRFSSYMAIMMLEKANNKEEVQATLQKDHKGYYIGKKIDTPPKRCEYCGLFHNKFETLKDRKVNKWSMEDAQFFSPVVPYF